MRFVLALAVASLALAGCASTEYPKTISGTPTEGSPVPGIPQATNSVGNSTAITELHIPDRGVCPSYDGQTIPLNVSWVITGPDGTNVVWTIDGVETADNVANNFGPSGALGLPFTCDGKAHTYGLVAQGATASDFQSAEKTVFPSLKQ